jgi:hypothetical protein
MAFCVLVYFAVPIYPASFTGGSTGSHTVST